MKEILEIEVTANNKAALSAFTQTQKSIFNLQLELEKYQSQAFTEKDAAKVRSYNAKIQELQTSIKQLSNVGKQGFDDLGNKIGKSQDAYLRPMIGTIEQINNRISLLKNGLKTATDEADIKKINLLLIEQKSILSNLTSSSSESGINGLTKAYSGLRKLAYIIPGIGIAGIFNLAFEGIAKLVEETGIFTNAENQAAQATQKLNDAIAKQVEKGAEDISHMKALISVAQDASLSVDKRKTAVDELRKLYPSYFKDLTVENALTADLTNVTNSLTQAIYKRAEARAREADIAEKAAKVYQNQQKIDELSKKIEEAGIKRRQAGPLQLQGGFGQGIPESVKVRVQENDLLKERDKLLSENSTLQLQVAQGQLQVNKLTAETIDLDYKQEKQLKKKLTEAEKWEKFLAHFKGKMQEAENASLNLVPVQEKPEKEKVGKLTSTGDLERGLNFYKKFYADIDKQNEDSLKNATKWAEGATSAFDSLFQAMQQGLSIGDAISKMFQDLAKDIAKAALKAAFFKLIIDVVSGGVSSGISFGDIFKSMFAGGSKGFAEGGTVSGPTSGYPAILHGTEHILRPDQLNRIVMGAAQMGSVSPGGMNINVIGKVAGNDIWLSQQRTNYYRGLTAGG